MRTGPRFNIGEGLCDNGGMKLKIYPVVLICALCAPLVANAETECLSVTETTWAKKGSEFGITHVDWHAELTNVCEASYDADLDIRFVDSDGKVLYQSRDLISVPRLASTTTSREFNIPDAQYDKLVDVLVTIKTERERPF